MFAHMMIALHERPFFFCSGSLQKEGINRFIRDSHLLFVRLPIEKPC